MPVFAPPTPGDNDLGQQLILKSRNQIQPWTAYLGTDLTRTSNVGLSENNASHDLIWRSAAGVSFSPRLSDRFIGNFSISQDVFRYDRFNEFNFESLNVGAGVSTRVPFLRGVGATVEFNYNRLTSDGYGSELFSEKTVEFTLYRNFILSRAHYFYALAGVQLGWADPEEASRDEFSALLGYHVRVARNFEVDLFYRAAYYYYTDASRDDVNQTVQLNARYNLTKWLAVNAGLSTIFNSSDRVGFDYDVVNASVGIFAYFKF